MRRGRVSLIDGLFACLHLLGRGRARRVLVLGSLKADTHSHGTHHTCCLMGKPFPLSLHCELGGSASSAVYLLPGSCQARVVKYGLSNTASNFDNLNNQFLIFDLCYASAHHSSYSLEACVGGSSYIERVPVRIGKRM